MSVIVNESKKHAYILSFASSVHGQRRAERGLLHINVQVMLILIVC